MSYDKNLWNSIKNELKNDRTRQEEMRSKTIKCRNNQTLNFYDLEVGKPDSSGYSLFICLHGGGQGAASMNDSQWKNIIPFEKGGFRSGTIAVAPRGITNTWNLHFVDESYPAITRLIENYIIFKNVNPNKVYLMGFSAGGDGTYALSERIPYLFAACSPQAGHPNGVSTINLCNLPTYLAAGEKDTSFKRNEICVEYYKKIIAQNGKYYVNYIAKVEVVYGSGHSFQCWITPRRSFFNGGNRIESSNDTAFTFMYSYTRNPNPRNISCDVKTFLTPLRNHYSQRGNSFYNIQLGKNPPGMVQIQINYDNNTINVKEGNNFRINLVSSLFRKGNVVTVCQGGKNQQYQLQKDQNYAKNNMKLYCDPNFGYDSYINVGEYNAEVNLAYTPRPAAVVAPQGQQKPQQPKPAPRPAPKTAPKSATRPAPKPAPKIHINPPPQNKNQLPNVNGPTKNNHNPAQYIDKGINGKPYMCVKLAETVFSWSNQNTYWKKENHPQGLMGKPIFHLNKVYFLDPKAHFFDVPKANYFLLLRHNPQKSAGLNQCKLTVKVDNQEVYNKDFFSKEYRKLKINNNLMDEFVTNINEKSFNNSNNHEIIVQVTGQDTMKKNWLVDGFILIPDNGRIETIYNQYFNVGFQRL